MLNEIKETTIEHYNAAALVVGNLTTEFEALPGLEQVAWIFAPLFVVYFFGEVTLNFIFWMWKGSIDVVKSLPAWAMESPIGALLLVIFGLMFPYVLLAGFAIAAFIVGDTEGISKRLAEREEWDRICSKLPRAPRRHVHITDEMLAMTDHISKIDRAK